MMLTVVFYINAFVWIEGVSKILPPLTIVESLTIDYNLHFKVIFGEYLQTFEGIRNDLTLRTIDALALGPNGNMQGGIRYYSLATGQVLQQQWRDVEILKMPVSVVSRVNYIYKKEKVLKGL